MDICYVHICIYYLVDIQILFVKHFGMGVKNYLKLSKVGGRHNDNSLDKILVIFSIILDKLHKYAY